MKKNPFNIQYLLLLLALIIALGIGALWLFAHIIPKPYPNKELFILIIIYSSMLLIAALAYKSPSIFMIHQFIGFKKCQLKFLVLALIATLIIWTADYFYQQNFFLINFESQALEWFNQNKTYPLWSVYLSMCVLAPIVEEMLFRGLLMTCLENYLSKFWNILLVSLVFTVVHASFVDAMTLFVASLFYAWIRFKSDSLYPSIVAHIINNTLTFIYFLSLL